MKHTHHIKPKHMGGTDDPSNLIKLTIEEHAEAHHVLFKQHGHWQDELAWKGLTGQIGQEEIIKLRAHHANLGKKHSVEHVRKRRRGMFKKGNRLSKANAGQKRPNISKALLGKKHKTHKSPGKQSPEHKARRLASYLLNKMKSQKGE